MEARTILDAVRAVERGEVDGGRQGHGAVSGGAVQVVHVAIGARAQHVPRQQPFEHRLLIVLVRPSKDAA